MSTPPADYPDHHANDPHTCHGISTDLSDYFLTRRQFLNRMGMGVGALSLAGILDPRDLAAAQPGAKAVTGPLSPHASHFPGKAKAVIHIFAQGAPSHVDTWDPKPSLTRLNGKSIPGGDIALQEAIRWADGATLRPTANQAWARAEIWSPCRSVAAHLLWGWYGAVKRGEAVLEEHFA